MVIFNSYVSLPDSFADFAGAGKGGKGQGKGKDDKAIARIALLGDNKCGPLGFLVQDVHGIPRAQCRPFGGKRNCHFF